jgi:predicted esterase
MRPKHGAFAKAKNFQLGILALLLIWAADAAAQARPNLSLARVIYNGAKNQANPQGELKEKLSAIEKSIAEATQLGRTGEIRRLYAQARTLLAGRTWTDELDFSNSLVLRAEEICLDSNRPAIVRVEQIYVPRLRLVGPLKTRVSIHRPLRADQSLQPGDRIKDLAEEGDLSRDLLDEPCRIELDLTGIPDGPYFIQAEISDRGNPIGTAALSVYLYSGLADRIQALESELKKVRISEDLRSDVRYPLDRVRILNRGKMELDSFPLAEELAASEAVLASVKEGRDPFAGRTGDMERHYFLEGAGEIMPYRVFVPKRYDGRTAFPLIIALHGLGANENSFFEAYGKALPRLAEVRGYIVAAPLGFRVDGFYGAGVPGSSAGSSALRKLEYSEKDVLNVLALIRKNYAVDPSRIYLMGHSMGAMGTWHLGAKYPDIWAALAPFAGYAAPATAAVMKEIPEIVVHGSADAVLPVGFSRAMVAELKKLGVEHRYIEVAGGNHIDIVEPNLAAVLDFFDSHRKKKL